MADLKRAGLRRKWPRTIDDRSLKRMKHWEIIADNLNTVGWRSGCIRD